MFYAIHTNGKRRATGPVDEICTKEYIEKLAASYGGELSFSETPFPIEVNKSTEPLIFGYTWNQIREKQGGGKP